MASDLSDGGASGGRDDESASELRWPDQLVSEENLFRIVEGVLSERFDFVAEAYPDAAEDPEFAAGVDGTSRLLGSQRRFAPEGLFFRGRWGLSFAVRDATGAIDPETSVELLIEFEICLSFSVRHHAWPFVDVMGGAIRHSNRSEPRRIDPFTFLIRPENAREWELQSGPED